MPKWLLPVLGLACGLQAASDPHFRFAELDGNKIHYLTYGQGKEAVVFIHGWTCDLAFWRFKAPVYEKQRSLLIDLPGHGMSDKPEVPYTMEYFARAVDAVLKDAKVEKATLAGHSMGTPVALQFLRMHPAKVSRLVIVDGLIPEPPKDDAERQKQGAQSAAMTKMYRDPDYRTSVTKMLEFMFTKDTSPAPSRRHPGENAFRSPARTCFGDGRNDGHGSAHRELAGAAGNGDDGEARQFRAIPEIPERPLPTGRL
jgi:pimeloyl-ACP methyl ester carboxylesterase